MLKKRCSIILLLLTLHCIPSLALAGEKEGLRIFFLGSGSADSPWTQAVNKGISEHLDLSGKPYIYFLDNLEAARFDEENQYDIMHRYLFDKFLNKAPDIFIAAGPAASNFSLSHPDLFPDAHRILIQPKIKNPMDKDFSPFQHDITIINPTLDFTLVVEEMLRLASPNQVFVIGDSLNPSDKTRILQITTILERKGVPYHILDNMSLTSLQDKVARLPKQSAIFYTPIYREHGGKGLTPVLVLHALNGHTKSPIFSTSDSTLGFGTVGGYIYSPKELGIMTGQALSHLVYNRPLPDYQSPFKFAYDWREVRRWGYQDLVGPETAIHFKTPSLWQQHQKEVIFVLIVMLFLSTLSFALCVLNKKLKKVKGTLLIERKLLEERVQQRTFELKELHEKAERMARLDELTGLDNRRSFFEKGEDIHYAAGRYNKPYSLMMLDIDHFKRVNDSYGHAAGDAVIQSVAQTILAVTRKSDITARIGGEEFAVIVVDNSPDPKGDQLEDLAERLRSQIADQEILFENFSIQVTVSIGLSRYQPQDQNINAPLDRADKALYTAKDKGRNRVV